MSPPTIVANRKLDGFDSPFLHCRNIAVGSVVWQMDRNTYREITVLLDVHERNGLTDGWVTGLAEFRYQ